MKQINKVLTIIACFAISSAYAKQTGTTKTNVQPANQTIFDTMPTYEEILSVLKKKKPTVANDFSYLKRIKDEAEYKINLIENKEYDGRAKRFDIKTASDMKTYSDILTAFELRSANPTDVKVLTDIKNQAEQQLKKFELVQPLVQPKENPKYRKILSLLQESHPTSSDLTTLNNIILEATMQRDQLK
jgi:hypothetical protein